VFRLSKGSAATITRKQQKHEKCKILQRDITKEIGIICIRYHVSANALWKWTRVMSLIFTYLGCCVYTRQWFMTLMTCRNAWCKLALTLNRALYTTLRLTSAWHDRMRSVVRAGGGHFETRHTKCRLETRDLKWIIICMIHQNFHQNAMKLSV